MGAESAIPNVWGCSKRLILGRVIKKGLRNSKILGEDLGKFQKLGGITFKGDLKGGPERFLSKS